MADRQLRIGVFVCDCGLNIAGTVDTAAVAAFAEALDGVVAVVRNRYTCADPGQNEIKKAILEHKLNRVVVASCTPKIHEPITDPMAIMVRSKRVSLFSRCGKVSPRSSAPFTAKGGLLSAKVRRGATVIPAPHPFTAKRPQLSAKER